MLITATGGCVGAISIEQVSFTFILFLYFSVSDILSCDVEIFRLPTSYSAWYSSNYLGKHILLDGNPCRLRLKLAVTTCTLSFIFLHETHVLF